MVIPVILLEGIEKAKKEEDDSWSVVLLMMHREATAATIGDGNSEIDSML